jgi:UV DNA damage endonuclease
MRRHSLAERSSRLSELCLFNALSLARAIQYCGAHGIGAFRVNSRILPVKTHPDTAYQVQDLPQGREIAAAFGACRTLARQCGVRLLFHPDPFILLNSPSAEVVKRSIDELEYQAEVADWIGADVINIHAGGTYGDKPRALARLGRNLRRLSESARIKLTLENDERSYTPADLLPFCEAFRIPMVYDVHHHRCLPDGLAIDETTTRAAATWDREPVCHISSPKAGWKGAQPSRHHDFISPDDFPREWVGLRMTVEVEAKAKELAVLRLKQWLRRISRHG